MPKIDLVAKDLDEVVHRKLVKQKDGEGFGNQSWANYFSHITKDVFLKNNVNDIIQKSTREKMLGVWCNNFAENIPDIRAGQNISDLVPIEAKENEDIILGTGLVIGRGPSLFKYKHLNLLAKNRFNGTIVASDGILIDCLKKGIVPDFIVSVDGNNELIWRWYDHPLVDKYGSQMKAILCVSVAHNVVERCKEAGIKIYWFNPQFDDYRKHDSFTKIQMLMTATKTNPNGAPNVACLSGDTVVYTEYGPRQIQDLKIGDRVQSFDEPYIVKMPYIQTVQHDNHIHHIPHTGRRSPSELVETPMLKRVSMVKNTGKKQVYELRTKSRNVKATANHLFLKYNINEDDVSGGIFTWSRFDELKEGDVIAISKIPVKSYEGDADSDLLRFLGCYLGDGWCHRNYEVSLSLHDDLLLSKYTTISEKIFHKTPTIKNGNLIIYSKAVTTMIKEQGFSGKALTKKIPNWIFNLNQEKTIAFLEGYIDADASSNNIQVRWNDSNIKIREYQFESPNKSIIESIRYLCIKVGWRVGIFRSRIKTNQKIWNGYKWYYYPKVTSYVFKCYPDSPKSKYGSVYRKHHPSWLKKTKYIAIEEIKKIIPRGETEVYDITVDDTHLFIADGIITHNCGGNAGATAWVIATNLLRLSPVSLIGIDLGYLEDTPIDETAYYKQMMDGTKNNVSAIATIFKVVENPYFKVKVKTDTIFQKYKESWIEMLKQIRPNIRTINCTEGGSLFSIEKGVPLEYMKFKDFLEEFS